MILSSRRYTQIKEEIADLYEDYKICTLPIDCFKLAQLMKIKLVPYSSLSGRKLLAAFQISSDGFHTLVERKSDGMLIWVIFYNDNNSRERQRFTIMHEIGHIVLDHKEESDLAEAEANFFAKYALAPPPLVNELEIEDYYDMAIKFDLSLTCAMYSMNYYHKWLQYGSDEYEPYEWKILQLFGLAVA